MNALQRKNQNHPMHPKFVYNVNSACVYNVNGGGGGFEPYSPIKQEEIMPLNSKTIYVWPICVCVYRQIRVSRLL